MGGLIAQQLALDAAQRLPGADPSPAGSCARGPAAGHAAPGQNAAAINRLLLEHWLAEGR